MDQSFSPCWFSLLFLLLLSYTIYLTLLASLCRRKCNHSCKNKHSRKYPLKGMEYTSLWLNLRCNLLFFISVSVITNLFFPTFVIRCLKSSINKTVILTLKINENLMMVNFETQTFQEIIICYECWKSVSIFKFELNLYCEKICFSQFDKLARLFMTVSGLKKLFRELASSNCVTVLKKLDILPKFGFEK